MYKTYSKCSNIHLKVDRVAEGTRSTEVVQWELSMVLK